ncbi:hypothetical protein [Sporosarcina sp. FSL W7-1283]|uniref:hypothetical protein n=1 Tax=Sporosarcina sp. FSL W7-1283 TaxID=2921560 RepID=UPI0030FD203C
MTNKNNQSEEKCEVCSAYSYFSDLVDNTNTTVEEAFHDAFELLTETIIEQIADDMMEKAFMDGYEIGRYDSIKALQKQLGNIAEVMEDEIHTGHCGDCDCDEGYCEREDDGTNYKKDDELDYSSVEDKIRKAIREDK